MLAADVVIIPVAPTTMDLDRLAPTLDLLSKVELRHQHTPRLHVLLTRVRAGTNSSVATRSILTEDFKLPVLNAEIPLLERYANAMGLPVTLLGEYGDVIDEVRGWSSMANESMAQLRDRVRKQVTRAHPQSSDNQETQGQGEARIHSSSTKPQKRRRSRWTSPYPDAMPFQTSVYLTDEDLEIIKSLRLKLHFAREWMVIKYALEELDKHLAANDTKQP